MITWTVKSTGKNRLDAFEMWCFGKIFKISSCTERVTNEKRQLRKTIQYRSDKTIGHN